MTKRIKLPAKKPIVLPPDRANDEVDEASLSVLLQNQAPTHEPKPKKKRPKSGK